jgi:hypothetical protein
MFCVAILDTLAIVFKLPFTIEMNIVTDSKSLDIRVRSYNFMKVTSQSITSWLLTEIFGEMQEHPSDFTLSCTN